MSDYILPHSAEEVEKAIENALNPTHWVEPGEMVEILPETAFTVQEGEDLPIVIHTNAPEIVIGETYTVNFKGTPYQCVAFGVDPGVGMELPTLGNPSMMGLEDTGEPFYGMYVPANLFEEGAPEMIGVTALDGLAEGTVSIFHNTEIVHKLDSKYMPDGMPRVEGGMTEILPSYTIASEEDMMGIPRLGLTPGNTYTVKINSPAGSGEWTCIAATAEIQNLAWPVVAIGNIEEYNGVNTGEPFVLVELPPEAAAEMGVNVMVQPLTDAIQMPVTFSIFGGIEKVHKLDNKFLDLDWKPKYTEIPLVPEVTITGGELVDVGVDINTKDDETFVVYYDGVRYVAKGISSMDIEGIGDITFANTPFFIHTVGTKIGIYGATTTHTVAIYRTSAPTLPNDMIPTNLSTLLLYSDGEYIYTDQERTARIRGEQFLDNFKTRRIVITTVVSYEYYVPLRTDADRVNYSGSILVTVMATGGESPTFKQLKTGPL